MRNNNRRDAGAEGGAEGGDEGGAEGGAESGLVGGTAGGSYGGAAGGAEGGADGGADGGNTMLGQRHEPSKRKKSGGVHVGLGVSIDVSLAQSHLMIYAATTADRVADVLYGTTA